MMPHTHPTRRQVLRTLLAAPLIAASACAPLERGSRRDGRGRPVSGITNPREAPFFAAGDGIGDDTVAIQRAIDAAIVDHRGGAVHVPGGNYRLTDTIVVANATGLKFAGTSLGSTVFRWAGPTDRPMFLLQDVRESAFTDFSINSHPARPLKTAIQTENGRAGLLAPSANQFENIIVEGTGPGGLEFGFRIAVGEGGNNNNEFHDFVRCKVKNYRIGFSIEHSQSHTNRFYSCGFSANKTGEIGLRTIHGSFYWYGGGGNNIADFQLGSANVTISIINGNFESSRRLVAHGGPTGARWPILIQGVRFSADRLHPDSAMIDVGIPGPLVLLNNEFGTATYPRMPRVRMRSHVPGITLVSHGNLWAGGDALETSPYVFEGAGPPSINASIEGDIFDANRQHDVTVFADGAEAPTVHYSGWFRTRNTRRTVIDNFVNGWPGKEITVLVEDDNTVFGFERGHLKGNGGINWYPSAGDSMRCTYDGKFWHCHRSTAS